MDYQQIINTYRQLHEEANAANEKRYKAILDEITSTTDQVGNQYSEVRSLLESIGQSEIADLTERGQRDLATADQDLINRGLSNTTIRSTVRRGIQSDLERNIQRQNQSTGLLQAGVTERESAATERLGQWLTGTMERKTDSGPDLQQFASLLQQGGGGGGYSASYQPGAPQGLAMTPYQTPAQAPAPAPGQGISTAGSRAGEATSQYSVGSGGGAKPAANSAQTSMASMLANPFGVAGSVAGGVASSIGGAGGAAASLVNDWINTNVFGNIPAPTGANLLPITTRTPRPKGQGFADSNI